MFFSIFKTKKEEEENICYYEDSMDLNLDGDYEDPGEWDNGYSYMTTPETSSGGVVESLFWILLGLFIIRGMS